MTDAGCSGAKRFAGVPGQIGQDRVPPPARLVDPRPNVVLAAKSADEHVTTEGVLFTSD